MTLNFRILTKEDESTRNTPSYSSPNFTLVVKFWRFYHYQNMPNYVVLLPIDLPKKLQKSYKLLTFTSLTRARDQHVLRSSMSSTWPCTTGYIMLTSMLVTIYGYLLVLRDIFWETCMSDVTLSNTQRNYRTNPWRPSNYTVIIRSDNSATADI